MLINRTVALIPVNIYTQCYVCTPCRIKKNYFTLSPGTEDRLFSSNRNLHNLSLKFHGKSNGKLKLHVSFTYKKKGSFDLSSTHFGKIICIHYR
jgi:hypothetical protein